MGCLALSYYEQGFPPFAGRSVFLSTAKAPDLRLGQAAQRSPSGNAKSCAGSYKFGFNGQEKVNEVKGIGNWIDYKERQYDPRLGRFISVDPLTAEFPWYTPYQFAGNTPIKFIDLDGLEPAIPTAVNLVCWRQYAA